ncbi:MAG: hypothetical protein IT444_11145 [Phycisphaeraceae bacterium]|nr:hypothetical protein [Phycisphaeraceae bacterium]
MQTPSYITQVVDRFWQYRQSRFGSDPALFDRQAREDGRPPVFVKPAAVRNVLVDPSLNASEADAVRSFLPRQERHRWFRSMKSSQALAQSLFGNLKAMRLCHLLNPVMTEEGLRPFEALDPQGTAISLERKIEVLREPRQTSVDVFVEAIPRVAVECKFTETDVGRCSRPRLKADDPERCNGSYSFQCARTERCSLTAIGVRYWEFVPALFQWSADADHLRCPLFDTYQLVRNVLAASLSDQGEIMRGYAVLLYDKRNPAFCPHGRGEVAYTTVKHALRDPHRLQRMTWQSLLSVLRNHARLTWLADEIQLKYGL